MKPGIIISVIFFLAVLSSCSKEKTGLPNAVLTIWFEHNTEPIEWAKVKCGRQPNTGDVYLSADGFDYEKFHLELQNITSTGLVQNLTVRNISFSNNYGFQADTLRSVALEITTLNSSSIHGKFEVSFGMKNNAQVVKATGAFSIHGQDQ
ncbi:MAG: hypothetical protein Q7T76_10340 [Ferruginibacter sp.]|nr:hypothetical protein [Ferruginibacter sp.]